MHLDTLLLDERGMCLIAGQNVVVCFPTINSIGRCRQSSTSFLLEAVYSPLAPWRLFWIYTRSLPTGCIHTSLPTIIDIYAVNH
jgi:hypothetical protein